MKIEYRLYRYALKQMNFEMNLLSLLLLQLTMHHTDMMNAVMRGTRNPWELIIPGDTKVASAVSLRHRGQYTGMHTLLVDQIRL